MGGIAITVRRLPQALPSRHSAAGSRRRAPSMSARNSVCRRGHHATWYWIRTSAIEGRETP
jgi:hypothetical protein